MKLNKLRRYWLIALAAVGVIAPLSYVVAVVPKGSGWTHQFKWVSPSVWQFGKMNSVIGLLNPRNPQLVERIECETQFFGVFCVTSSHSVGMRPYGEF